MQTTNNTLQPVTDEPLAAVTTKYSHTICEQSLAIIKASNERGLFPAGAINENNYLEAAHLVESGYLMKNLNGFELTWAGETQKALSQVPADEPTLIHDNSLTPLTGKLPVTLTDEEKAKKCVVFLLEAGKIGWNEPIETNVYAVCEPAGPWQWLEKGRMCIFNHSVLTSDLDDCIGERKVREIATGMGRVKKVRNYNAEQYVKFSKAHTANQECGHRDVRDTQEAFGSIYYVLRFVEACKTA